MTDAPRDEAEQPPHEDPITQARIWQDRLVRMARKGAGSKAQQLAGRLLDEHGLDARRRLADAGADAQTQKRAQDLLDRCGLAPWGPTTHLATQEDLL